jgi:hypothetical protein
MSGGSVDRRGTILRVLDDESGSKESNQAMVRLHRKESYAK